MNFLEERTLKDGVVKEGNVLPPAGKLKNREAPLPY